MQLKINHFELVPITFNFEELKAEVEAVAEKYANIAYTEEQIAEAKADRAKLNKLKTAIDAERKRLKKEYTKPFEAFERQVKEVIGIIDEPIQQIDSQCKKFEEQQKNGKALTITQMWNGLSRPQWLNLKAIWQERWLNKSVSLKQIEEEILAEVERIRKDISLLEQSEMKFEAIEIYKKTLDFHKAYSKGQELLEMQKRKEEAERKKAELEEARRQAEQERQQVEQPQPESVRTVDLGTGTIVGEPNIEPIREVKFRALMTVSQAKKLKAFCDAEGIEIKRLKEE